MMSPPGVLAVQSLGMAELQIVGIAGSARIPTRAIGASLPAGFSPKMKCWNAGGVVFVFSGRCGSSARLAGGAQFVDFGFSRNCCVELPKIGCSGTQLGNNHEMSRVRDGGISLQRTIWSFTKGVGISAVILIGLGFLHGDAAMANIVPTLFPWEEKGKEQVEPSRGNCATCIGVVDETLGTCNSTANCVSSFDDRPRFFVAPWEFPGKLPVAVQELKSVLAKAGANIEEQGERYVHAIFKTDDGVVDDVEFLFSNPREDATVVLRSASRATGSDDKKRNRNRLEDIRKALTWEQVPVLRNRKRALFFLESPWDTFGPEPPPSYDYKRSSQYGSD